MVEPWRRLAWIERYAFTEWDDGALSSGRDDFPLCTAFPCFSSLGSRQETHPAEADLLQHDRGSSHAVGTRKRNARAIARVMESVGASMGTQAHEDYSEMGFVVPAAELDRALSVMTDVLHEPSFPRDEISKEKSHVLASLNSRHDAIFNVAYDHLNKILYAEHPYGRPLEGREETIKRFDRNDFQTRHHERIRPERGIYRLVSPLSLKIESCTSGCKRRWGNGARRRRFQNGPHSLSFPI